jgi:hypothetical protein
MGMNEALATLEPSDPDVDLIIESKIAKSFYRRNRPGTIAQVFFNI